MTYLARPTFTLHYEDRGPRGAPAVVLLPSLLCDVSLFEHLAGELERRYRVIGVDLRGHGKSTTPSRDYALEDQADDVAAVLDDAGVASAAVVGLSQGGMTGLRMAIYHPRRVRALVVMNSSGGPESTTNRLKFLGMAAAFRAVGLTSPLRREVEKLMFSPGFRAARGDEVARRSARFARLDPVAVQRAVRAVVTRTDLGMRLAAVRTPTLVVAGEFDRAQPVANSRHLVERLPGAELAVIEGAGHLSTIEQPEATTRVVARFLDASVGRA